MSSKLKEDWTLTLNQVDAAIEASLDVVRAAWDDLSDNNRTSTERVTARGAAIRTLDNLGKQWSAIATKLATVREISLPGKEVS